MTDATIKTKPHIKLQKLLKTYHIDSFMFQLGNLLGAINYRKRASSSNKSEKLFVFMPTIFVLLHIMAKYQVFINSINIYATDDIKHFPFTEH